MSKQDIDPYVWHETTTSDDYIVIEAAQDWLRTMPAASAVLFHAKAFGHEARIDQPLLGREALQALRIALTRPSVYNAALDVLLRAEGMGLCQRWTSRIQPLVDLQHALTVLSQENIGRDITFRLVANEDPEEWSTGLTELLKRMEASATPDREWSIVRRIFNDDHLALLLGVQPAELSRFSHSPNDTPDDVASRLHYLALIVADLSTGYNDYGVRRWFERPRRQLDGKSPGDFLRGDWSPDESGPQRVRALARSLIAPYAS